MEEMAEWFLRRIAYGKMTIEDAQKIASLTLQLEDVTSQKREATLNDGLHSAMLADIAEIFFDHDCNRETWGHVPPMLSHSHAGWACGPRSKKESESWLRYAVGLWNKDSKLDPWLKDIDAWEAFLAKLKSIAGTGK
jgi:hypothetical protein